MGTIYYDSESGKLEKGHVWVWQSVNVGDKEWDRKSAYAAYVRGELEDHFACPVNKKHQTGSKWKSLTVELYGGQTADLVPMSGHGANLISGTFADKLKASGLKGYAFGPKVTIGNQSKTKDPVLYELDLVGNGGVCKRFKVKDAPNLCPHCKKAPAICYGCGKVFSVCGACEKDIVKKKGHKQEKAEPLLHEGFPTTFIVEKEDWDGSDVFRVRGDGGNWFVSKQAKEWLERTHIYHVRLIPALLNVDRVIDSK